MNQFNLTITNNFNDYDLYFDIFDTNIAIKWKSEIEKNYDLYETDRFTNWPNSQQTAEYYINELNEQIKIINLLYPSLIPTIVTEDSDQSTMNYLHKFFENLRGPINEGTTWFSTAPIVAQTAINRFNILIHEYEHYRFNQKTLPLTNHPYATIVGTFSGRDRYDLEDNDYQHFTFKWNFGYVYINYCEVGKPLLDVFKDNDDIVGDSNIRPLNYYSADFQIKFGPDTVDHIYKEREEKFWQWFESKKDYFDTLGLTKSPKLSLGLIPVAKLNIDDSKLTGLTQVEIINKLSHYQKIKSVCIK